MIPTFQFKEFSVSDDDCGMKLSSDAVLLGAYVQPPQTGRILDIGCGCGILSLMMAQRSQAMIDAVEIDEAAASQAGRNFEDSRWAERLQVFHEPVQEFATKNPHAYDGIISNPPYFHNQLGSADVAARQARHTVALNYCDLCRCASELLTEKGLFWVILPASERMIFLSTALQYGLYGKKILSIFDQADKGPLRIILCLSKSIIMEATWEELIIKKANETYTAEYIALTKDFYLGSQ